MNAGSGVSHGKYCGKGTLVFSECATDLFSIGMVHSLKCVIAGTHTPKYCINAIKFWIYMFLVLLEQYTLNWRFLLVIVKHTLPGKVNNSFF